MRLSREILKSYYEHVPFVINSGYAQNSRGLFGPSGADHKKAPDGFQKRTAVAVRLYQDAPYRIAARR